MIINNLQPDSLNNERELLLRIAQNNENAFADFVLRHTDRLYSYILKITKSEQWAEELVQDVWMQVWLARKDFALLENPLGYLHRMAQNRALDWIRRNKRDLKIQYFLQQQLNTDLVNPIIEKVDYDNITQLLHQSITQLPPQRRRIFELKQSGLSYEEIATQLKISKNTVRNQMVSALCTLREYLKQHEVGLFLFFCYFFL
ncbi:RNA polymerase sigma factor [Chitinophaga eiseniae]|uniref:Sigma-70 family RNA polymerase sigma factor n=1 Tax=Chitinophaga eiseniae TaxID=634771 RepID=A0A847SMQ9_9BACT|nr:sigma-70 family RNA polymerase sigma factor [Chitinophaga eiseniae]NLR80137.1 sigma-70 family RNA polymerase sigma factor [Chitinophaga eiseniae]